MESDESSDEDFSAIELPSIIDRLKRLLEQYSDGQIVKELIQNAEDGGATEVKFLYNGKKHKEIPYSKKAWEETPIKIAMQAPALCVYNNGIFTDKDWKGIAAIQCCQKENEPLKVGRFGLGFKSVFHLTDFPLILSGDKVMVMNPLASVLKMVHSKKLCKIDRDTQTTMLDLIGYNFGFSELCFKDGYPGTLFWFPLRTQSSALSRDTYTYWRIQDIFRGFKHLAPSILLFLKKIEKIEVYEESENQGINDLIYRVEISAKKDDLQQKKEFLHQVEELNDKLANEHLFHYMELCIICEGKKWLEQKQKKRDWVVVNHYHGGSVSKCLKRLIDDDEWSYSPYISVAGCLSHCDDDFKGHIFSFLPLPLERTSPTGLPVHINGFFALSQDRHHIKWMSTEEENRTGQSENSLEWNKIIATEILPLVYLEMLTYLIKHDIDKNTIYKLLPQPELITENWKIIIKPLFKQLYQKNVIFSKASGGRWIKPGEAIVLVEEEYQDTILQVIEEVYILMEKNVACLPDAFVECFESHGQIVVSDPSRLHDDMILHDDIFDLIDNNQKMKLLEYFISSDIDQLKDLKMLPLANGEFQIFDAEEETVFWYGEESLELFPGMESRFLLNSLSQDVCEKLIGRFQVTELMPVNIPVLLQDCIEINKFRQKIITRQITDWLNVVWKYIHKHIDEFQLSWISHLHLLPFHTENTSELIKVNSVSILRSKENMGSLDQDLSNSLEKLGVKIITSLNNTISVLLEGEYVQCPTTEGIFNCLKKIKNEQRIERFNQEASRTERNQLLNTLANLTSDQINRISPLIKQLKIFEVMDSNRYVCLNEEYKLYYRGIHPELPILYKGTVIKCTSHSIKNVGELCGCTFLDYEQLIEDILSSLDHYNPSDQLKFMEFYLEQLPYFEKKIKIMKLAGDICFIENKTGKLVKPKDLLDPRSTLLKDMFQPCDFPSKKDDIKKLRKLGLKFEEDLTGKDILNIADTIIDDGTGSEKIHAKGMALCRWIDKYRDKLDKRVIDRLTLKSICPIMNKRPESYPKGLPFKGEDIAFKFKKPRELFSCTDANVVGGVGVLSDKDIPQCFKTCIKRVKGEVFEQLKLVATRISPTDKIEFLPVLNCIYNYINNSKLDIPREILTQKIVWTGFNFRQPSYVYCTGKKDDLLLEPFRYLLPPEMKEYHSLFERCGCMKEQNDRMLLEVLSDIREKHDTNKDLDVLDVSKDTAMVLQIINKLANSPEDYSQSILLPIHTDLPKLLLKPASECTVCNESWLKDLSSEDEIFNINKKISPYTAARFKVPALKDRLLCDADHFDMNFSQDEPLTTRLKNLLKDYTDGFTVPKEIIQNADDAGASVVKFLYDERNMPEALTCLFDEGMEPVQGPAFWAYNDAKFTDADFENITKLARATKKDDQMKIGRFGLGFNSVYNLTDTPSFISGDTYVIFDPHETHLKRPGLKIKLNHPNNRKMRQIMTGQFYPFDGVFKCKVLNEEQVDFDGTLFRFPLRNQLEADKSLIKDYSYSKQEMKKFIQKIADGCGNLLLFTQNVRKIELHHLLNGDKPNNAQLILEVTKSSNQDNTSALQVLTSRESQRQANTPAQLSEEITISISIKRTETAQDYFQLPLADEKFNYLISWSFGKDKILNAAKRREFKGLLPIAGTAVLKNKQEDDTSNFGFYDQSHLFCFLPLPIPTRLPAHVNGSFALQSSRRDLLWKNDDDIDVPEDDWNICLLEDACCQAYLMMMTTMARDVPKEKYNKLWPNISECTSRHDTILSHHIYKTIRNGDYKVFQSNNGPVSIKNAVFLDPTFRDKAVIGEIALKALWHFTKTQKDSLISQFGGISVVDLLPEVWKQFNSPGCEEDINHRMVTIENFYSLFFPTLTDKFWSPEEIDELLLYSLQLKNAEINKLIVSNDCIPTKPNHKRLKPNLLIHPNGDIAGLFDESEERFPDDSKDSKTDNFRSDEVLDILTNLGMMKDDLPCDQMPERITVAVNTQDQILILNRFEIFLTYMSRNKDNKQKRFESCPEDIRQELAELPFLPVKTLTWEFPQFTNSDNKTFVSAHEAYLQDLQKFVGCTSPIVDIPTRSYSYDDSVLKWLGVKHTEQQLPLEMVLDNMLIMSQYHSQSPTNDLYPDLETSFKAMYKYLNDQIDNQEQNDSTKEIIRKKLEGKAVVLHSESLTTADVLVLESGIHIEPYISSTNLGVNYEKLFTLIGVSPKLTANKVLEVLSQINNEKGDKVLEFDELDTIAHLCRSFVKLSVEELCMDSVSEKIKDVKLPDSEKKLTSIESLCFDDSVEVYDKNIKNIKHLHKTFDRNTAEVFGVKSKSGHSFDAISSTLFTEFGQHEELTNRIQRILEGYPGDESILKEMLQNADDAGATEVIFIKDCRTLPTIRLPDQRLEDVQGPALCVFNNSFFTEEDLKGIQKLGTGSKKEEPLKTGQYGVGFNVVYRVTDVPSFWSKGGDVGETVCIFDPHCKYLSMAHFRKPGVKIDAVELSKSFPDFNEGYLPQFTKNLNQGTLFRLPLRNKHMADLSEISNEEVTEKDIYKIFKSLKKQIFSSMLFLENITSVKFGTVKPDGRVQIDYIVESCMDKHNQKEQESFNNHLLDLNARLRDQHGDAFHLVKEVTINVKIQDSLKQKENYLIVKRAGFNTILPHKLINALKTGKLIQLPRGGIAVNLKKQIKGIAFCTLPLPINTGLPVHVNGQFALDHESRRHIWNDKTSVAGLWNSELSSQIIVPAYLRLLDEFKLYQLSVRQKNVNKSTAGNEIKKIENLLPKSDLTNGKFWKDFVVTIYTAIGAEKSPLFAVLKEKNQEWYDIEWVPVQTDEVFNGCFQTLYTYFHDETEQSTATIPHTPSTTLHLPSLPLNKPTEQKHITLKQILIKLGMKVLETSEWILGEFKQAEVKVQSVNPEYVLKFLKSYQSDVENKCQLSIPEQIQNTPFGSFRNFNLVLKFVLRGIEKETVTNLFGSPLLLRQSNILDFYEERKVIVTRFYDIFEEFGQQFIHSECVDMLERYVDSFPPLTNWSLESFNDMFGKSASYEFLTNDEIIPWNEDDISFDWICKVWKFISQHLPKNDLRSAQKFIPGTKYFKLLSRLSILPIRKGVDESFLYPLSKAHYTFDSVMYTPSSTNHKMKEALLKLNIPMLKYPEIPMKEYKTLRQTVASIDDPDSIVKLLINNLKDSVCDCSRTALDILKYFNDRIDDIKLGAMDLRQLNLFETHENSLTSVVSVETYICLVEDNVRHVPKDGINHWADTSGICILKYHYDTQKIFNVLGIKCVTPVELYYMYILPYFHCFLEKHHMIHLEFVRDLLPQVSAQAQKLICCELQEVKFLPKPGGSLFRACDFYDKTNEVFKTMFTDENFVPHPYNEEIWYLFLESAGLVTTVSSDMFVQFAKEVESLAMKGIDENILAKSDILLLHLRGLDSDEILEENLLPKIKDIKFVKRRILGDNDNRVVIDKQFNGQSNTLVSFSGSFLPKDTNKVWTVGNLIESSLVPIEKMTPQGEQSFNQLLGISTGTSISFDIFERNMKNVCSALEDKIEIVDVSELTCLFEEFYEYMNMKKNISLSSLSNIPMIFLPDEKKLVKPWRVILKPEKSELINGKIFEVPKIYIKYFNLFESLGVKLKGEPSMYLKVLEDVYRSSSSCELHVNEFRVVKQCLINLVNLWENIESAESILYLPSMDKKMEPSTSLIFIDNEFLYKRLKKSGFKFFIGFEELDITVSDPLACVKHWPKQFHMKILSEVFREERIDDGDGIPRTDINRRLHHPDLINSLVRVLKHLQHKHKTKIDTDDVIEKKVQQIMDFKVISIENLTTQLLYNDNVINKSQFKVRFFQDKLGSGSKVLYMDSEISADDGRVVYRLSKSLRKILKENISEFFILLWPCTKSNPQEIQTLLDEMNIRKSGYECKLNQDIFPEPGTFIPEDKHWLLDNSFVRFDVEEYVGFEVYDPDVNNKTEEMVTDTPVYIYAVVIEILQEETESVFARYKIDIGEETKDVDSTKIYKFHRNLTSKSKEIELSEESAKRRIHSDADIPNDKKSIVKEIRQLLTKAWKLTEADRKRVIKRLLLKWHPDKNLNIDKLATEITQEILDYIDHLKAGRSLEEDYGGSYNSFYSNIDSRGRSYAQNSEHQRSSWSYSSDSSFHFRTEPTPRPDEARRWFRQARIDIDAAEESHSQNSDNNNWICYMCQQSAEKALKAVWYTIDLYKVSVDHDLSSIASDLIQYPELVTLAGKLQSCIGHHTRMRYPDTLNFPKVPKDVYGRDDSTEACKLTREIISCVANIVH